MKKHANSQDPDQSQPVMTSSKQDSVSWASLPVQPQGDFCVWLTPFSFAFLWLSMAVMHVTCITCFGVQSWVYWQLPLSSLASSLELYSVTNSISIFRVVAVCYGAIASAHGILLLWMVVESLWSRTFTFGSIPKERFRSLHSLRRIQNRRSPALVTKMMHDMNLLVGEHGIFGIKGRHFAVIYAIREALETMLQSIQAFHMSQFVPRMAVNRFFLLTIVINCWSSPVISHLFKHNPALERLLFLIFDVVLDFISSVGVPVFIAIPYWHQYDFQETDFSYVLYWNDFWLVNMINELRIVFVSSWTNLICELSFSVSLLVCLQDVKYLIRPYTVDMLSHTSKKTQMHQISVKPVPIADEPSKSVRVTQSKPRERAHSFEASPRFVNIMHTLMVIWGTLLLMLHLRVSFQSTPSHCDQPAWPWFGRKPGCTLLRMNCIKTSGSTGNLTEMETALAALDEQTLTYIVIRHCPYVEIPARLQRFPNLVGLKIFNSTLAHWDSEAALTATHHPKIVFCFVAQSNLTQIPLGLQSIDFPSQLKDIEFAWTNLSFVPNNIGERWPDDGFVMLERGRFDSVPQGLLNRSSRLVSLASNNITTLPDELFTNPAVSRVWLNGNPIVELPIVLEPSASIERVDLSFTLLRSLPSWADVVFFENTRVNAGGTPLCEQILSLENSIANNVVPSNLTVAWNAYQSNRLLCNPTGSYFYPYEAESLQDSAQ